MVLADGDQVLAAETGFHSDPPRRGGFEVSIVRRIPDHRSEPGAQQPENGMALRLDQRKRRASPWKTAQAVQPLSATERHGSRGRSPHHGPVADVIKPVAARSARPVAGIHRLVTLRSCHRLDTTAFAEISDGAAGQNPDVKE
ncbi:MAG: hypothetical protein WCS94_16880 [Verrucomicrobiota bacterium]